MERLRYRLISALGVTGINTGVTRISKGTAEIFEE